MNSVSIAVPARNPWVAVDVATDPVAHATVLARAHERSLTDMTAPVGVRELVLESWKRCLAAGVAPEAPGAPVVLSEAELEEMRERSPLAPAVDAILTTLSGLDAEARHVLAIGDAKANLLWVTGNLAAVDRAREMHFQEGAAWSESAAGTNAVGTAAALDHPVQIFSAEHLVAAVHPWTCSGAPIHDPASGELIGVVDLTAELRTAHPHTLSLATAAARAAEITLRLHQVEAAARLRERWEAVIEGRRAASVLIDRAGRVIASRGVADPPKTLALPEPQAGTIRSADGRLWEAEELGGDGVILWLRRRRSERVPRLSLCLLGHRPRACVGGREERGLRSLELLAALAMHPEGLTAEQLALALYWRAWEGRDRPGPDTPAAVAPRREVARHPAVPTPGAGRRRLDQVAAPHLRWTAESRLECVSRAVAPRLRRTRDARGPRTARGVSPTQHPHHRRQRPARPLACTSVRGR